MSAARLGDVRALRPTSTAVAIVALVAFGVVGCGDDDGVDSTATSMPTIPSVAAVDVGIRQVLGLYGATLPQPLTQEQIECVIASLDQSLTVDQLNAVLRGEQDPVVGELFDGSLRTCGIPVGT